MKVGDDERRQFFARVDRIAALVPEESATALLAAAAAFAKRDGLGFLEFMEAAASAYRAIGIRITPNGN